MKRLSRRSVSWVKIIAVVIMCVVALSPWIPYMKDEPTIQAETRSYESYNSPYTPYSDLTSGAAMPDQNRIYVIETAEDLYQFSMACYGSQKATYLSLDYVLGDDIDYNDASRLGRFFRPIGFYPNPNPDSQKTNVQNQADGIFAFQGTFDGQGFEIHNLLIEPISLTDYQSVYANVLQYYAMFSVVGATGVIRNLGIVNPIMVQAINHGSMTGASMLAGVNHGTISYVSVVDNRISDNAGMNVNGNFRLAGLVVVNYGSLMDSFVASIRIRAKSVSQNFATRHVYFQNFGTISRLYFDFTITEHKPIDESETIHALATTAFQTRANFSSGWFVNSDYPSANQPDYRYPVLKGFARISTVYPIRRAADLVYLSKVIDKNWSYNTLNYQLYNDIDMASVSRYAMVTPVTNFTNTFQSIAITANPTGILLYSRTGTDNNFFSILNLSLHRGTDLGAYAGFGLFGSVSGTIRDLNFFNVNFPLTNQSAFENESFISAGVLTARLNNGNINNVKVHVGAGITGSLSTKLYLGGLVGSGNGNILSSSVQGTIDGGVHVFRNVHADSAIGGIIGYAGLPSGAAGSVTTITSVKNFASITGISFTSQPTGYVNVGGLVGMGNISAITTSENWGTVVSQHEDGYLSGVSVGGIIGYQTNLTGNPINVTNYGDVRLVVNSELKARVGVGYGVAANVLGTRSATYTNLINEGEFSLIIPEDAVFLQSNLASMDIIVAGVMVTHNLPGTFTGWINRKPFLIDVSFIRQFAGLHVGNNNYDGELTGDHRDFYNNYSSSLVVAPLLQNGINYGSITASSSRPIYFHQLKIAGVGLGKGVSYFKLRNEADITVSILHDATSELDSMPGPNDNIQNPRKNIIVSGVIEQVIDGRRGDTLYNHGTITVSSDPNRTVRFHLFVSGVAHRNRNLRTSTTGAITRMLLNDGAIVVDWHGQGSVVASGLVAENTGSIQTGMNLGDVFLEAGLWINPTSTVQNPDGNPNEDFLADAAGVAGRMDHNAATGQIINTVNYGNIHVISQTGYGRVAAGGLLARNNRREDHLPIEATSFAFHNQQIRFSINYGDISSWNSRIEKWNVTELAYSTAGGILANGYLRIDTSINYGHVYSNTSAGGIVGQWTVFDFAQFYTTSGLYFANLINYGDVRRLVSPGAALDSSFRYSVSEAAISTSIGRNGNQAFGGIIGSVHVGSGTWSFHSGNYAFPTNRYQHLLNMDDLSDAFGSLPTSTTTSSNANTLSLNAYSIKHDDESQYPYLNIRSYSLDNAEPGGANGLNGTDFSGIFYPGSTNPPPRGFPFMDPVSPVLAINNFIKFIPTNRVNNYLLTKIGLTFDPNDETKGIFALGPSTGIGEQGLYLPDHIAINEWNPLTNDASWQNEIHSGGRTVAQKIGIGMKQLSKSLATNIDNIQLVDIPGAPTLRLTRPIIDKVNYIITFYVADNSIYAADPNRVHSSETRYMMVDNVLQEVTVNLVRSTTPKEFHVNTQDNFLLGYRASFFYETGNPNTGFQQTTKIQSAFGLYPLDGAYYNASGEIIDQISDYAGKIRVYAEAYDPIDQDPLTFRDYSVRIVRLPGTQFTDATLGSVNGTPIDLSAPNDQANVNLKSIPAFYKPTPVPNGQISVTFATANMPVGETPHLSIELYTAAGGFVSQSGNYSITTAANNQSQANQNAATGVWGNSTATYVFTLQQALASGEYYFRIRVDQTQESIIRFVKMVSEDNLITSITTQNYAITASGSNYVTDIPYGLYFNPSDSTNTRVLNFTNLPTLTNIPAANLSTTANRPSCLNTLVLSPYSTLVSVSAVLLDELESDYLHRYVVTYVVRSESGIVATYTHTITERLIPPNLTAAYNGVNLVTFEPEHIKFPSESSPTIRYEYATANLYAYLTQGLSANLTFTGARTPVAGTDYVMQIQSTGMQFQFMPSAPVGFYDISYDYFNTYTYTASGYPLQGKTLQWNIEFQDVLIHKQGSSNAHLMDITFTSDFVYSGLNTILHPSIIDAMLYSNLLTTPTLRQIVLIPTVGINYNETLALREYYIVGQVADTNLVFYKPDFFAQTMAKIVRVYEDGTETEILEADFTPEEATEFRYIHYRVYAEDYIEGHEEYGTHVNNYYVAVQDVTNNIYLTIEVHLLTETPLEAVFVSLLLTKADGDQSVFTLRSLFEDDEMIGVNLQPRNTSSGIFSVSMMLPSGLTFTVEFDDVPQSTNSFLVPETVIARLYTIRIYIDDAAPTDDWGQRGVHVWTPSS